MSRLDFIVTAKQDEYRVLQITDMQIIDSAQQRYPTRLQPQSQIAWRIENVNDILFNDMDRLIEETKPDLIIVTGDLVYGSFDDKGTSLRLLIDKMESYALPWAPVWGNHDQETLMGVDWQCRQLEQAEHCLFKKGTVTGTSNYTVGICDEKGALQRVLYMLDSHGCVSASEISVQQGVKPPFDFAEDQLAWMRDTNAWVCKEYGEGVPAFFCCHNAPVDVIEIMEARGKYDRNWIREQDLFVPFTLTGDGEFGEVNEPFQFAYPRMTPLLKEIGADGVFSGHYHLNNYSVVSDGIRWTHGMKTGRYDYYKADLLGGTVIDLVLSKKSFTVSHYPLTTPQE